MTRILTTTLAALAAALTLTVSAQTATSLKISEIVVSNPDGLIDEYGQRAAWIEICNTSWGTVNLRSCYITNNRDALGEMSVPERVRLMSMIPKGDSRTALKAKEAIVLYADGKQNLGTLHTGFTLSPESDNFIALFDGNGHTLLDSVTVPAGGGAGCSYARFFDADGKNGVWRWCDKNKVTPGKSSGANDSGGNKIDEFRQNDPHGFGMAILGMGIVFTCLLLLSVFFHFFGKIFVSRQPVPPVAEPQPVAADSEAEVMAVIALALAGERLGRHDKESGVITIRRRRTNWTRTGGGENV